MILNSLNEWHSWNMVSRILALILLTKLFLYTGQAWALPQCIGTLSIQTWTNCQGSHTYSDSGDKYIGEFLNNKRHGQGVYYYSSGAKYVGDFKDGEPHGQGSYKHSDEDLYVGDFRNGEPNGQGMYTYLNGDKHTGVYLNGKANGAGVYTYSNGDKYDGNFRNGIFRAKVNRLA